MKILTIAGSVALLTACTDSISRHYDTKHRVAEIDDGVVVQEISDELLSETEWIETKMYHANDSAESSGVIYQYRARYFGAHVSFPDTITIRVECKTKHNYDFYRAADAAEYNYPLTVIDSYTDMFGYTTTILDLEIGEHLLYAHSVKPQLIALVGRHGLKTITLDPRVAEKFYEKLLLVGSRHE